MSATARGGTFMQFRNGTVGASARHVAYVTRERAVVDREQGVLLYNLPEHVGDARSYDELRANLIAHAGAREDLEIARHRSRGEPRTHYRALLSFERDVTATQALRMAREWLEQEFPKGRGFAVVHRDTEHTHVHVWLDARQVDAKKIQLSREQYRSLDSAWNRIYSRELERDPLEHERKKAESREAKLEGWEQGRSPDLPDRARPLPEKLIDQWRRREIGVHAALQPGREREGASFLEHVRLVASHDLRDARSWDELDRRLERHGLHIEARGRGMVITDGRRYVKASAVYRDASRGRLEQRFGMTLLEHVERLRQREGVSPRVKRLFRELQSVDRGEWLRRDRARWEQVRDAARERLEAAASARDRARSSERALVIGLAVGFRDAERARHRFEARSREVGGDRAAAELASRPERFGELRRDERRSLLALVKRVDPGPPREWAQAAAVRGREWLDACGAVPGEASVDAARRDLERAEDGLRQLDRAQPHADRGRVLDRIGAAARRLAAEEIVALERMATVDQRRLLHAARRVAEGLVPNETREVGRWVLSPRRQLSAAATTRIKAALADRDVERQRSTR